MIITTGGIGYLFLLAAGLKKAPKARGVAPGLQVDRTRKHAVHGPGRVVGQADRFAPNLASRGLKVVFTNGVFDLLHRGHVTYLAAAAAHGDDALVVGVNGDDERAKRLGKGPKSGPLCLRQDRAAVVAALRSVVAVWFCLITDTPLATHPGHRATGRSGQRRRLRCVNCTDPADPRYIVGSAEVRRRTEAAVATIDLVPGRKARRPWPKKLKG